jgi:hypothetical protein
VKPEPVLLADIRYYHGIASVAIMNQEVSVPRDSFPWLVILECGDLDSFFYSTACVCRQLWTPRAFGVHPDPDTGDEVDGGSIAPEGLA